MLTEHQEAMIDRLVQSGRYQNVSEVLREGLRLLEAREAVKLQALREAIDVGLTDLEEGRFSDFASFDELEDYLIRVTEEALKSEPR